MPAPAGIMSSPAAKLAATAAAGGDVRMDEGGDGDAEDVAPGLEQPRRMKPQELPRHVQFSKDEDRFLLSTHFRSVSVEVPFIAISQLLIHSS